MSFQSLYFYNTKLWNTFYNEAEILFVMSSVFQTRTWTFLDFGTLFFIKDNKVQETVSSYYIFRCASFLRETILMWIYIYLVLSKRTDEFMTSTILRKHLTSYWEWTKTFADKNQREPVELCKVHDQQDNNMLGNAVLWPANT